MTSENMVETAVWKAPSAAVDDRFTEELVARAQSEALRLTGGGGLFQQLTKRLLESAPEGGMSDRLGYDRHDPAGKNGGKSRNGKRSRTVVTEGGPVRIEVPRDPEGFFEPRIVTKRRRRLTGVDVMVLSLSARGPTHGETSSPLAESHGAEVSGQTISTVTGSVMEGTAERQARPLDRVHPVVLIDRVNVKIRVLSTFL